MKLSLVCILIMIWYVEYTNSLAIDFSTSKMANPRAICERYKTATTKRLNFCQRIIQGSFLQVFCYLFDFMGELFKLWGQLYRILEAADRAMEERRKMLSSTPKPKFWNRLLQRKPFNVITEAHKKTRILYYALRIEHQVLVNLFAEFMKHDQNRMYDPFDSNEQSEMQYLQKSIEKTGDDLKDCVSRVKTYSDDEETTTLYEDVEIRPQYSHEEFNAMRRKRFIDSAGAPPYQN